MAPFEAALTTAFAGRPAARRAAWIAAPLATGALASATQAPASAWPLIFFCLPLMFWLWRAAPGPGRAAWLGWLFGVGYFLPGLLWVGEAFLVDAEVFGWMRPFAVTLLPMGLALFWAGAFAAAHALAPTQARAAPPDALAAALTLASVWAAAEYARGTVLTGFPWGMIGFAWVDAPVAQAAAWIGPYGLNALSLAGGLALGAAAASAGRPRLAAVAIGILPLGLVASLGAARLAPAPPDPGAPLLRLVQPNVPQVEKWAPEFVERNYRRLIDLSAAPAAERPDIVIWPETATTPDRIWDAEKRAAMMAALGPAQRLVLGTQRYEPGPDGGRAGERWYNSLFSLGPGGRIEALYDKHHLVPFGEYLPFQSTLEAIGLRQLAGRIGGFATGPGPQTLTLAGGLKVAPLICYEAIFPWAAAPATRPDLLLQITNDAWFGDSGGPRQHLAQARMRAIEQGVPLVRAANTGITAAIDPYGRIVEQIPLDALGAVDLRPPRALAPTFYARYGEAGFALILVTLALAAFALRLRRLRQSHGDPAG